MKFLADENIATSVVSDLRKAGFDTKDIKEENLRGASDKIILNIASAEDRIIITHDKDFANILSYDKIKHKGIILIRLKNQSPKRVSKILLGVLQSDLATKISNKLTIITETQTIIHTTTS